MPVQAFGKTVSITNVSYDPTREMFEQYNKIFEDHWKEKTGDDVEVIQSHGGSGKQALEVANGLDADVVTLALEYDIESIENAGLIKAGWKDKFDNDSSPYTSTIVFLVKKGNPRDIKDWDDLVNKKVEIITPDPKSSGGQVFFMRNIRTVGDHNAHADGEREECEAHGVEQRVCRDLVPLRREEELKTFPGTGQRQTANNQDDHQHKQQRHHDTIGTFDSPGNSHCHNNSCYKYSNNQPEIISKCCCGSSEHSSDHIHILTHVCNLTRDRKKCIFKNPSDYHCISDCHGKRSQHRNPADCVSPLSHYQFASQCNCQML